MTLENDEPTARADAPARDVASRRFFYGWTVVAVLFVVEFTAYSTTGATITLFFPPMIRELGWSLTQLTGAVTAAGIAGMFAGPIVGPILDRYGSRPVLVTGALSAGIALLLMTQVQEVWQYWLLFAVVGALGIGEMGRLSTPVVISKWFIRRRGRALAIATSGNFLGGMTMAPILGIIIATAGWRTSWGVLAGIVLLVNLPLVLFFMRRIPEDMGLLPDGGVAHTTPAAAARTPSDQAAGLESTWTLRTATRTRTLWLLVVASNLVGFATSSVSFHQVTFFVTQHDMSLQGAGYVLSASLLGSASSRFVWGFVVERVSVRVSLATMAGFRALGTLSLVVVPYPFNIPSFVILWALLGGAFGLLQPMAWANYYGRRFQGSIQGTLRPALSVSRLIGPVSIAVLFDATGSYTVAFVVASAMAVASVGLFLAAKQPVLPSAQTAAA